MSARLELRVAEAAAFSSVSTSQPTHRPLAAAGAAMAAREERKCCGGGEQKMLKN